MAIKRLSYKKQLNQLSENLSKTLGDLSKILKKYSFKSFTSLNDLQNEINQKWYQFQRSAIIFKISTGVDFLKKSASIEVLKRKIGHRIEYSKQCIHIFTQGLKIRVESVKKNISSRAESLKRKIISLEIGKTINTLRKTFQIKDARTHLVIAIAWALFLPLLVC